ncbi:endonuclease [Bacillus phage 019DV002]|uniref:Endonuclease n=1 Tax=Bacillus phage 019DV002 TaxID=2601653 RepID=A0A5J6T4P9_9CAUD|nr:endonuclease [Bacillus phage 019DV002]QFG05308.1 endonuclease [Bacillus phage 019DV004]
MKIKTKKITREGNFFRLEGSSELFDSPSEAIQAFKNTEKAKLKSKAKDGRRFWSHDLQMPFRSYWEIDIAELMTNEGIAWEYEPRRVYFRAEQESYLPDFYLPQYNCFIEVKGYFDMRSKKRCKLFKKYYGSKHGFFLIMEDELKLLRENPKLLYTYLEIAEKERERVEKQIQNRG